MSESFDAATWTGQRRQTRFTRHALGTLTSSFARIAAAAKTLGDRTMVYELPRNPDIVRIDLGGAVPFATAKVRLTSTTGAVRITDIPLQLGAYNWYELKTIAAKKYDHESKTGLRLFEDTSKGIGVFNAVRNNNMLSGTDLTMTLADSAMVRGLRFDRPLKAEIRYTGPYKLKPAEESVLANITRPDWIAAQAQAGLPNDFRPMAHWPMGAIAEARLEAKVS